MQLLQVQTICIILLHVKRHECSVSRTEEAVYFKPNTEYIFQLKTNADLQSARIDSTVKIGLVQVSDLLNDTGQEICLNIHSMELTSVGHKAMIHEQQDLTKWFSIKMRRNGAVYEVVYPADEDLEVVNLKKNLAGMFSGHLQFDGDEIHYHSEHRIPTRITLNEQFEAPNKVAQDFDPYEGLAVTQSQDTINNHQKEFPEMRVTSESDMTFLYTQKTSTPMYPSAKLVVDTLQIKSVPPDMAGFNETMMWTFIRGNLTCMRNSQQKVSETVKGTQCFQKLVYLLRHVPEKQVDEIISHFISAKIKKRLRDTYDRFNILDALVATNSEYIQDLLTDAILLSTTPDKLIVQRFLMISIANNKTVSKHFVKILQNVVFEAEFLPEYFQDRSLQRTAIMTLGAIASRLNTLGRHDEAIQIVSRIEESLGIHDPWEYNRRIVTLSPKLHEDHHLDTAAMVEALGNAGFPQSLDHIVSFTNSTDTPSILRRSGLNSLRNYASKEVADLLLSVSEGDMDKQVRKVADQLFKAHPYGNKINESYTHFNDSDNVQDSSVLPHSRQRRGTLNNILNQYLTWDLPYNSDGVLWKSGNDNLGASIGYRLRNSLKLKVRLLNGILEIDALNNAHVRLHVGILGFNVDVATADQCFDGAIEIRINPFKEIKCAIVEQFLNAFDRLIQYYLRKLAEAIEDFTDWLLGPDGLPQILDDFGDALQIIPQKAYDALHRVNDALVRFSRLNPDFLPPIIKPVSDLILRAAQMVQDFQKDLMEFYNAVSDSIIVILHSASEQLIRAIQVISDNTHLAEIVTSPHTAIENIYKALVNSQIATDAILKVKQILEDAGLLGEGPSPFWKRTSENIASLQDEVIRMKEKVDQQFGDWIGSSKRRKREVPLLGAERLQREEIHREVIDILDDVWTALNPLKRITDPLQDVANHFYDSTKVLKRLFQNLRNSYLNTKSEIVKTLGPNVHPDFPRELRLEGHGCRSNGLYPSTADGYYSDQGIDLVTQPGQKIVAPYSGSVSISKDEPNRIRLVPTDGGFLNTVIYIDNITPANNIPSEDFRNVVAGTTLGVPANDGPCSSRHIHFVVKSEMDPKPFVGLRDKRETSDGGRSGTGDPSMYLNDRVLAIGAYKRGCDDFNVKILGFNLIRGRLTQDFRERDISPEHTIDLTGLFGRRKRSSGNPVMPYSSPAWFDVKSVDTIVTELGLPIPDFGKPYPVDFNFNTLKMGPVLTFFQGLAGNDIADRVTDVLRNLVILITDTPCVNPARLTEGQLIRELYKRGESKEGSRAKLTQRYLNPDDRCPLLQISLPESTYCHIDQTCLAVECCVIVPFLVNQISLKTFVRYDPCDSTLTLGIHPWKLTLHIPESDVAIEQETSFAIDLKGLGQHNVQVSYTLEKTEQLLLASFSFSICTSDDTCLVSYDVFKELAFMLHFCHENETISLSEADVLDYLKRTHILTVFEESGYLLGEFNSQRITETLNISPDIISSLPKCRRPETWSHQELVQALETYEQITSGTTDQLLNRLSLTWNNCNDIVLLALPQSVSEMMNCFLSPDCQRVECCLSFEVLEFKPSFRVSMELNSCDQVYAVGFEDATSTIELGTVSENGISDVAVFGWIQLRYDVRLTAIRDYSVSFGVAVCPNDTNCILDANVIDSGTFVISSCNVSNNDTKPIGAGIRKKRQGHYDNDDAKSYSRFDDSVQFWKEKVSRGDTTLTSTENMSTRLTKTPTDGEQIPSGGNVAGAIPLESLLEDYQEQPSPVDNILNLPLDDQSSNIWPGINVVGGGLTDTGISVLTTAILESDLSTIKSLIDAQELHKMKSVIDNTRDILETLNEIRVIADLIKQLQQVLRELIENGIDDILYLNLPPEFQARDFIINAIARIPEYGRIHIFPLEITIPIPIGIATLEFYVGIGAGISIEMPATLTVGTMTYKIGITPGVAMAGWAGLGVRIFFFRLSFEFVIELLGHDVPISREGNYCKFPIEVTDRVDLVVTPLVLRLYIKVQIKVWRFTKTLYKKELWKWSSPSLRFNLKKKVTYKKDTTIPDIFDSLVDMAIPEEDRGKRSIQNVILPDRSKSCFVEQIAGLDYTEPAIHIQFAASDDVSYVTYTLSVGTEPGGMEVINNQLFGGPSAVITKPLMSGVPLYFTIRATNSGGGTATATCHLPTYDTTLPGGRLDAAFSSTSHPNILRASAVLHEDSEIIDRKAGIGFGAGIWGDQIVPWEDIGSLERQYLGSTASDAFDYFTTPKSGRLVSKPVASRSYLNPNFCARDCLALPASKCLGFNYDYGPENTCEILEEIEGHGVQLHQSGLFSHFERLGVGHAVEIEQESLQLRHNDLYYFNIHTNNVLGYQSVVSSKGIIADFTPPEPGIVINAASDKVQWEDCKMFVPEEWEHRCTVTTPFQNHRIVEDGKGSKAVFNGHHDLEDLFYTRANKFISANWDGFYDNETGIYGYTWSVGSDVCRDDVSDHIDPHSHLFDESEWTHEGIVTGVYLEDGHYFITVRALNKVEFGGPMAVSVCHTTPYIIDTTPPFINSIWNVSYDTDLDLIGVNVNSTDPQSGIMRNDFALGRTPRDTDILPWQPQSTAEYIEMKYKIPDGVPAWVKIRTVNNVELSVTDHSKTALFVDTTPPIQGIVTDGEDGHDLDYFKDSNRICASWKGFHDTESGISSYLWAVGSQPGSSDIVDYITAEHDDHYACADNLRLQHNTAYFSTIVAFNGGIKTLNTSGSSNGVTLDLTPPEPGFVYDGSEEGGTDVMYSSESASVAAFWGNFSDPESDIENYLVSVHRQTSLNENQNSEILHSAESVGKLKSSIEWHHFHLRHNDYVYVNLRTRNGAQNQIDTESDGYRIDLTPPVLHTIGDGEILHSDVEFQTNTHSIASNWLYQDGESGILYYQLAIYELKQGNKRKIFPTDFDDNSFNTIDNGTAQGHIQINLQLQPGAIYTTLIKAINGAKLVSSHETSGIRIDPSPPKMIFVRAGSVDGDDEEVLNGYVYQSDRTGIMASWLGDDPESKVKSFWVTVGTQPHTSDVKDFLSLGADHGGYISGLILSLTIDEECLQGCHPVYYVCVKAENGAGEFSDDICSSPIKVVPADKIGYVTDGPQELIMESSDTFTADVDAQLNSDTITVTFAGFASNLNGIRHFEWAIGTTPGGEDIQPFMSDGMVLSVEDNSIGLPGSGKAQAPVDLKHGEIYYASVRAITGSGDILESTSDGVTVDQSPPDITLLKIGQHEYTNKSQQSNLGVPIYQEDTSSITAMWNVQEHEGAIDRVYYSIGTYPQSSDIKNATQTTLDHIPFGDVRPIVKGQPNLVAIDVVNSVGLKRSIIFPSLIVDTSPPLAGQVWCSTILHARGILKCAWSGFSDPEGLIRAFHLFLGSRENEDDIFRSQDISPHLDTFEIKLNELHLEHNYEYYVTVEAVNSVGQRASAFSRPVLIDDTPPVAGIVVELSSDTLLNQSNTEDMFSLSFNHLVNDISEHDASCIGSITHVHAAWEPFSDPETKVLKYEVAVGNSPHGTQIKQFVEVSGEKTTIVISNLGLNRQRQIYVTVRGYNEAGLFTSVSSNGAYISRQTIGLPPLHPLAVNDGTGEVDRDFQSSLGQLDATWDFSGYPCPMQQYEWAIRRIDGKEVQPFTSVGEQMFGTNSELDMTDGETYYVIVRGTNALGATVTVRSDGVTVQRDPLIPGHVFDGPFVGTDINYQQSIHVLHASWVGFGGQDELQPSDHTGNDEVPRDATTEQTVDYYEVAVGTDRSSPKSRDNVVPFKNVGRNTTVVFDNLSLQPLSAVYYVTVRAHSVSYASTEVSSNGITTGISSTVVAGKIEVPRFVDSVNTVDIQWSDFQSTLDIKFYYIAIADISNGQIPEIQCKNIQLSDDKETEFGILPFQSTNLDTYKKATGLNMTQLGTYAVHVLGFDEAGECNVTSSTFIVDNSVPITGKIRTGPVFNMSLDYTSLKEELQVWWTGFEDPESGIRSYRIRLVSASSCKGPGSTDTVVDWIQLDGNYTEYRFVDITLSQSKPFFVELEVTNNAGSNSGTKSSPILFDMSSPIAGIVVDGPDFKQDARFHGDTTQISGSFIHLPNPEGSACPLQLADFTDTNTWTSISMKGLWNMNGESWDIWYLPEQVTASKEELEIILERDVRKPRVLSGGYATDANILRGGKYEIDMLAAPGDVNAITNIVFWDGLENTIGGYQEPTQEEWWQDSCACCFEDPTNSTCICNCVDFGRSLETINSTAKPTSLRTTESSVEKNQTEITNGRQTPLPWQVDRADNPAILTSTQRGCGLQLKSAENNSQAVLWCRYANDEYSPMSITLNLPFDPSREWHKYGLLIDSKQVQWKVDLFIDDNWMGELDGIPEMSDSTKLVLHVWNLDNFVPVLEDEFLPPQSVARFRSLRLPPLPSNLCRYGDPFRGGSSPVIRYRAGIGSEPGLTDIVTFHELAKPCFPCLYECDHYHCHKDCPADTIVPYTFTLSNITLPESRLTENITTPVFLTVESLLGNGHSLTASSNGITVDTSPPILDYMFYIDVSQGEYQPVNYQSSNTTIKAYWNFVDDDSEIAESVWAIGTQPGGTDLQDFVSVGIEQIGSNSGLEGYLLHNHTYYVTLKGINGAGIAKTIHCPGVTVLTSSPVPDGVNTTVLFSEELSADVYPPNSKKMIDGHHVGLEWSKANDEAVTKYEYCVGSSQDTPYDIVECIPVANNSSGSVSISDGGEVSIVTELDEAKLNITQFPHSGDINNTTSDRRSGTHMNLEPGKTVYSTIQVCNSAELCSPVHSQATTIIPDNDEMLTSIDGEDLTIPQGEGIRRKRSLYSNEYTYDLNIQTSGGLHKGGSLVFGYLHEDRLRQVYDSDAVTSYRPYVVNPLETLHKTSRLLRKRILRVYEPPFYLTSLGQLELNGSLLVNLTFSMIGNLSESVPVLLFWNPDDQEWHDAARTCLWDETVFYNIMKSQMSVQVCDTRHSKQTTSRKRRVAEEQVETQRYFQRETQFAVTEVSRSIVNEPPVIHNAIDVITIREDEGTIQYQLRASDPDGDKIKFYLDSGQPTPNNGDVSILPNGLLTYTPCSDCYGEDMVTIVVEEVQSLMEIPPLSKRVIIKVVVTQEGDEPVIFVAQNGKVVGSPRKVTLTVEENAGYNATYQPLSFIVGAYDVDSDDNLTIEIRLPLIGRLSMARENRQKLLEPDQCHQMNRNQLTHVPCGLMIPKEAEHLTWHVNQYTYTPNMNVSGIDELQVVARDKFGLVSRHLTIIIGILRNPCIHGKCKGPADDKACEDFRRSLSFDGYICECNPGFSGDQCQLEPVTELPGVAPTSTYAEIIVIIAAVVGGIICIITIAFVIICYKKRNVKSAMTPDDDLTSESGNPAGSFNNICMDVFAVDTDEDSTESPKLEKTGNNDMGDTDEKEKNCDLMQEPLHSRQTTINVAGLCNETGGPQMSPVD